MHKAMVRSFKAFGVFCLAVTLLASTAYGSIWCKDDNGKNVNWSFIYKLPQGWKSNNRYYEGNEYVYVDSTPPQYKEQWTQWTVSSKKIDQSDSALANTIAQITAEPAQKVSMYAYNNKEYGKNDDARTGHTKGIIMFDDQTVVLLIHSVPNFPKITEGVRYEYPESGLKYGQIVFCATFGINQLDKIKKYVSDQEPNIYHIYPTTQAWTMPLREHTNGKVQHDGVMVDKLTGKGNNYRSFAKSSNFQDDVYLNVIAADLDTSLLVSTWRRTSGRLRSECEGKNTVENIVQMNFNLGSQGEVIVKNTSEHGKWAISKGRETNHVCVATLNNEESQFKRGGGALCFKNTLLHNLLLNTVTVIEECPATNGKTTTRRASGRIPNPKKETVMPPKTAKNPTNKRIGRGQKKSG